MGEREDESYPATSPCKKCKSSEKILHDCGALNNALVPRKPRSAMKKRARQNFVLPCPISRKSRVRNGINKPRVKKSRFITKEGGISKDEEEVVETLNALAQMFSDSANTNNSILDDDSSKIKPSTQGKESEKMNRSNHSSAIVENVESSRERSMVVWDQAEIQRRYTKEEKCKGILISPSLSSTEKTRVPIARSFALPTWSGNASSVVQPSYIGNKYPLVMVEPKKTWKRCSTHVRIARLIKAAQNPEAWKGFAPRPTQLTISRGVDQWRQINDEQTRLLRAGSSLEALNQFHLSYQQLRTHPAMPASSTFHGRTSAEAALQVKLSSSMMQQRWLAHGGVAIPHLPEWQTRGRDSASFFNETQARFSYLHSAIRPKYQLSPPQLTYMPFVNSSLPLSNTERRHFNPAFERNRVLYSDNLRPHL